MKKILIVFMITLVFGLSGCKQETLTIATTTSLDNSGLLEYIIPTFEKEYGIKVEIIAVGTGAALEYGKAGAVEILLVHDYDREVQFVEDGYGTKRESIMHNDFIIIGPSKLNSTNLSDALNEIMNNHSFYSRGDNSGTHSKELSLWNNVGLDPSTFGGFYKETGQGMGGTITMADISGYYTLSDRATYLSMLDNINLVIGYENMQELKNLYGVIKVNPELYSGSDKNANLFYDWIQSDTTKNLIDSYEKYDTQLFYTN